MPDARLRSYERALNAFNTELVRSATSLILKAGEIALVNNSSALHSRGAFNALIGPDRRWLRRIFIADRSSLIGGELIAQSTRERNVSVA